jgi:biotin carboxyl carrier protein
MSKADALMALAGDAGAVPEGVETIQLLAPAVGIVKGVPTPGRLLGPCEVFASLTILDLNHPLMVPEGVTGVVSRIDVGGSGADALPVEYAQPILTLSPLDATAPGASPEATGDAEAGRAVPAGDAIPEGCHAVTCAVDGIFYRRPRPTDDPYVEVGTRVHTGQTLALIEAMKTFSPIPYGGPGLPAEAEIVEIRAADTGEVRHGQILFVVRDA